MDDLHQRRRRGESPWLQCRKHKRVPRWQTKQNKTGPEGGGTSSSGPSQLSRPSSTAKYRSRSSRILECESRSVVKRCRREICWRARASVASLRRKLRAGNFADASVLSECCFWPFPLHLHRVLSASKRRTNVRTKSFRFRSCSLGTPRMVMADILDVSSPLNGSKTNTMRSLRSIVAACGRTRQP